MRKLIYMAHPVAPSEAEIAETASHTGWDESTAGRNLEGGGRPIPHEARVKSALLANLDRALRWLSWLRESFPETTFIAPWIAGVQSVGSDGTPEQSEAGLIDCCAVVERCDGIVLVGGRISGGMRREMEHGATFRESCKVLHHGFTIAFQVYDLTPTAIDNLIRFPTWSVLAGPQSFDDWYRAEFR